MKIDFELSELIILRASIGSEIDIVDEELDSPIHKLSPTISRGALLRKRIDLTLLLEKIHNAVQNHEVTQRQRSKLRTSQRTD